VKPRIIAGEHRGRRLFVPKEEIRPTADRTKESLFSTLESILARVRPAAAVGSSEIWAGIRVIDFCAGTGALGLEALSRGAAWATFVDAAPACVAVIRRNLTLCDLGARARVLHADARRPPVLDPEATILFVDPPYDLDLDLVTILHAIARSRNPVGDAVLAVEHRRTVALPDTLSTWERLRERRFGETQVTLFGSGVYRPGADVAE